MFLKNLKKKSLLPRNREHVSAETGRFLNDKRIKKDEKCFNNVAVYRPVPGSVSVNSDRVSPERPCIYIFVFFSVLNICVFVAEATRATQTKVKRCTL